MRYPKLAGQNPRYLYQQLVRFYTGVRPSTIMPGIVATLTDADSADAATFYGQQTIRADTVQDGAIASVGERIFLRGTGTAPACAMCHGSPGRGGMMMGRMGMMGDGMMGCGMMADVPNLYGQHATYLIDQLNRFAAGQRPSMMMGMMNRIAASISDADKEAIAVYLSGHLRQ